MIRGIGDRGDVKRRASDMKVLLTLYGEERPAEDFSPEDGAAEMAAWQAFDEAARAAGVLIACEGLAESHTATTIRVENGERRVTDGPFIETKEQLGGFIYLDVRDLDEALAWSERTPWNHEGCYTEIRPIMDYQAWEAAAAGAEQKAS
jgi:hypothetical protein